MTGLNKKESAIFRPEWTPSRLKTYEECPFKYRLNYIEGVKQDKIPEIIAGKILHKLIETFYKPGQSEPAFKSPGAFANVAKNRYEHALRQSKVQGYYLTDAVKEIAFELYINYSTQQPPLGAEVELPLFSIDGVLMWGIVDEIGQRRIRDHKSRKYRIDDYVLATDDQFTWYAGCNSVWCREDPEFAKDFGVLPEESSELLNDPLYMMLRTRLEHHWLNTGRITEGEKRVQLVQTPARRPEQFYEIIERIHTAEWRLHSGDLMPNRGEHCARCLYKKACDQYTKDGRVTKPPPQIQFVNEKERIGGRILRLPLEVELVRYPGQKRPKQKKAGRQRTLEFMRKPKKEKPKQVDAPKHAVGDAQQALF